MKTKRSVQRSLVAGVAVAAAYVLMLSPALAQDAPPATIPLHGKSVSSFVPGGFHILASKEADLNGDGLLDAVVVFEADDEVLRYEQPRPLIVLFKEIGGGYKLVVRADNAVSTASPGVHGDAFSGIKIQGKTFALGVEGGSPGSSYHFQWQYRYQNGDWYLIGTRYQYYAANADAEFYSQWCPTLHLSAEKACVELDRSRNFNTHTQIDQWKVYPTRPETKEPDMESKNVRTIELRRTLPRKASVRLSQVDTNASRDYNYP